MKPARTLALGLLALTACAGPRPEPPLQAQVVAPPVWRDGPITDATVDAAWWTAFQDPVLTAIVTRALAGNPDIAIAASRVQEARAQFRLADAQTLPNLVGGVGGARQRDVSPFGRPREQTAGQVQVQASYDLDLFGRLASSSAAARESLLASQAARDNVRLAVASSAAGGYIALAALDARLAVLRDTLASRQTALRLIRRRTEGGYASMLDLRQAEADVHATEQLIPPTLLAIRRQEDGLSLLLGENPRAIERGVGLDRLVAPTTPAGLPSALLRRRPDLAQAERQLAATDRSLDAARAAFLPAVQLTATGGVVDSSLLADPIDVFSLGGSVLAPLFDAGRLRAQADAAAARRDQAAFAYRRAALNAFREVEDALAAVRRTDEQARALERQHAALSQALVLARNRYQAGYSPYLDQLEAQRGLLAVELQQVQARSDRLNASVALFQALGGGWALSPSP